MYFLLSVYTYCSHSWQILPLPCRVHSWLLLISLGSASSLQYKPCCYDKEQFKGETVGKKKKNLVLLVFLFVCF